MYGFSPSLACLKELPNLNYPRDTVTFLQDVQIPYDELQHGSSLISIQD